MRALPVLVLSAFILHHASVAGPVCADAGGGTSVAEALLRDHVGARPASMGGAYAAEARGALAQYYNPAGLFLQREKSLFLQYNAAVLDVDRSDIGYAQPFMGGGLSVGVSYISYGAIQRTTTVNKTGTGLGTLSPNDLLLRVSYGKGFSDRIAWGATLGYYRIDLEDADAYGVTSDFGLLYRMAERPLTFGVSLRNLGTSAKFERENESLPLALLVGGAWRPNDRLNITADVEFARGRSGDGKIGVEFWPFELLALRAGYDGRNDAGEGWTAGFGVNLANIMLDYAYVPFGDFGNAHRLAAEWSFGKEPLASTQVARRADDPRRRTAPAPSGARRSAPSPSLATPATVTPAVPVSLEEQVRRRIDSGNAFAARGETVRAADEYGLALQLDPDNHRARYNLATVLYTQGLLSQAIIQYERLLKAQPSDAEVWFFLGMAQYKSGYRNEAAYSWRKTLEFDPGHNAARRNLDALGV